MNGSVGSDERPAAPDGVFFPVETIAMPPGRRFSSGWNQICAGTGLPRWQV